jgi:hydroxypyruvate isomerase
MEFSACIEWLFGDEPVFADRITRCAEAGIKWAEFWWWRDKDLRAITERLQDTGVCLTAFITQPEGGLVDRRLHDSFVAGVEESARIAVSLGCRGLLVLVGPRLGETDRTSQLRAIVDGLRRCAPIAADNGVTLLVEPVNTRTEDPNFFLDATSDGLAIVEEVDSPNVRLLYDLFHSTVMGEDFESVIGDRVELIGHIHVADFPGRHEPGTGTIGWTRFFDWLAEAAYGGRIGLEYQPSAETLSSLDYVRSLLPRGS